MERDMVRRADGTEEVRDDTRDDARLVYGILLGGRRLLETLHGRDDLQKDTLKAALDNLGDTLNEVRGFIRQREQM